MSEPGGPCPIHDGGVPEGIGAECGCPKPNPDAEKLLGDAARLANEIEMLKAGSDEYPLPPPGDPCDICGGIGCGWCKPASIPGEHEKCGPPVWSDTQWLCPFHSPPEPIYPGTIGGCEKLTAQINAAPELLRSYIMSLDTNADSAGDKFRLQVAEENVAMLLIKVRELEAKP